MIKLYLIYNIECIQMIECIRYILYFEQFTFLCKEKAFNCYLNIVVNIYTFN